MHVGAHTVKRHLLLRYITLFATLEHFRRETFILLPHFCVNCWLICVRRQRTRRYCAGGSKTSLHKSSSMSRYKSNLNLPPINAFGKSDCQVSPQSGFTAVFLVLSASLSISDIASHSLVKRFNHRTTAPLLDFLKAIQQSQVLAIWLSAPG